MTVGGKVVYLRATCSTGTSKLNNVYLIVVGNSYNKDFYKLIFINDFIINFYVFCILIGATYFS